MSFTALCIYLFTVNSMELNIRKKCYKILNVNFTVGINSKTSHKISIKSGNMNGVSQCRNPEMANSNLMYDELVLKSENKSMV